MCGYSFVLRTYSCYLVGRCFSSPNVTIEITEEEDIFSYVLHYVNTFKVFVLIEAKVSMNGMRGCKFKECVRV